MPVAAGIVGCRAAFHIRSADIVYVTAESGSPAVLNRTVLLKNILHLRHRHLPLVCAHAFLEAYPGGL